LGRVRVFLLPGLVQVKKFTLKKKTRVSRLPGTFCTKSFAPPAQKFRFPPRNLSDIPGHKEKRKLVSPRLQALAAI
jgi:hypothetical protein